MQQLATKLTCFLSCCSMATAASPHALPLKQPLAPGGAPPPRYSATSQRAGSLRPGAAAGGDEGPPWTECDGEGRRVRQRPATTLPGNTSWPASSASVTGGTPTPTSGKQREAKGSRGKPREAEGVGCGGSAVPRETNGPLHEILIQFCGEKERSISLSKTVITVLSDYCSIIGRILY